MKEFHVEVISNASYETNTCAEFKNKIQLLHPLDGEWEMGISEISYTKSWYNLPMNSTLGIVMEGFEPTIDTNAYDFMPIDSRCGTLRKGYYDDIETLVDEINKEISFYKNDKIKQVPYLYYDKNGTKLVSIIHGKLMNDHLILPYLDYDLRSLLGYTYYMPTIPQLNSQNYCIAHHPPDLSMGIRHLLVYCNLILPQYVGDSRTKLLRCVEIPNNTKFGDQVTLNYEKPHYVPVLFNDFDEIEINIKDDLDQVIRFTFGRSRVKLHFRKI